jgi:hypothetical protein
MQKRVSVATLKKEFRNNGFFLSGFFRGKAPCISFDDFTDRDVETARARGYDCVPMQGYYYVFKKD